jgi:hypothetical protein
MPASDAPTSTYDDDEMEPVATRGVAASSDDDMDDDDDAADDGADLEDW